LKTDFFPKDLSYFTYVDIWLPENASIADSAETSREAEEIIRSSIQEFSAKESYPDLLRSLTVFIGGSGPRFWFSLSPEPRQENYAQIIIEINHKQATTPLVHFLQKRLSANLSGARADVRELETGPPIGVPVAIRISGDDSTVLREYSHQVAQILAQNPLASRIHDNWGADRFIMQLEIDQDRLAMAHLTDADVILSMNAASKGIQISMIRDRDKQIPVMMRLRMNERSELSDLENAYLYPSKESHGSPIPLRNIANFHYDLAPQTIRRRDQFRTIEVSAFPVEGALPSEILRGSRSKLDEFARNLPPGYKLEYGGEYEEQIKAFRQVSLALVISIVCIFGTLVIQFNHLVKPWIVFSAIPFGISGAFFALRLTHTSFGFMAFLGVSSLVGVIVSHVIVLFDSIEEEHRAGRPFVQAILDAGIQRIRPVLITIGATVLALFPLALHGGPLWQPLCYAQIGGLTIAAFVTLLLVPVIYSIFVLDLQWIQWTEQIPSEHAEAQPGLRRDLTSEEDQTEIEPRA
jgi:multidrug efflux pump subunit AcrB